jgi:predicted ATP-grasp superfamily ATP-dependent carboligase
MTATHAGYERFLAKIVAGTPAAFILGCERAHGLAFARSLGRKGVPVVAVGAAGSPGMRSRYSYPVHFAVPGDDAELLGLLDDLGRNLPSRGVLLPADDAYVLFVSRNRSALNRYFDFVVADSPTLEKLANKKYQYEHARSLGIPIPETHVLDTAGRIDEVADEVADAVGFPCLIKPAYSHLWRQYRASTGLRDVSKLARVDSRNELIDYYGRMSGSGVELIVQELIEGEVDGLYALYTYVSAKCEPLALFIRRKLRQWPILYGNGCYSTAAREPSVLALGLELLRGTRYRGLANIEFMKDPRDGQLKLIEFNVRSASQIALAVDAGVDIPFIAYSDTAGKPVAPVDSYREDVKWIDFGQDLGSFTAQYQMGRLGFFAWVRSVLTAKSYAYFARDDLRPAVSRTMELIKHGLTRRRPRKEENRATRRA